MTEYENHIMKKMEEKLMELMGEEYYSFAVKIAREALRKEAEGMEECDFKNFILDNFERLTE